MLGWLSLARTRRFGAESSDEVGILREFRAQGFDRDFALEEGVERGVHLAHRADAEQFDDAIVSDHLRVGHGSTLCDGVDLRRQGARRRVGDVNPLRRRLIGRPTGAVGLRHEDAH